MTTVLVSVDMEGVAGVTSWDHVTSTHKEYDRFRRLMTAEANTAVEGALAGGADRVIVNDSHGGMTNLLIEELNPAAELISGSPKPFSMMEGIGPDVDAVFFVGYHAAAGTEAAILDHTWSSRCVHTVRLDGRVVGEAGLNAALAGAYGAPVVLVSGDRAVIEGVRALLSETGEIETVAVKDGAARNAAHCLHPEIARERIRQAAERALALIPTAKPFVLPSPITVQITFQNTLHADMAARVPDSRQTDGRTVEWTGADMPAVYRVFRAMTTLAGSV
jgi:D-amino peptidase